METASLILFAAFSIIHLYDSYRDNAEGRAKTKPFLLLFLLLFYVSAAKHLDVFLALALLFSWLGDVLLIPKGHKWFTIGGISFMISHLFFILTYRHHIHLRDIPLHLLLPAAVLYYGISLLVIRQIQPTTPKKMIAPMYFYLLCNSTMNLFSFVQLWQNRSAGAVIAFIGAILFFMSDCCLFLVRYYKDPEIVFRKHFTVMLTYLLGELMIVLGILKLMI
ncbi:MAG: lysoplasmalogenase [Erysipelotrichaceae bacterium]|nr:lysoplasmalogenase [Erysipelotrichaceae bacterium]MBQ5755762.1 lysoplasmalogenase [Erysipelotrichaceae bacterium]